MAVATSLATFQYKPPTTYGVPVPAPPPRPPPNTTDDYERWYTENNAMNRMLLSLMSGIPREVTWSLDRLCRICSNEQFLIRGIPGLMHALFEWPIWYLDYAAAAQNEESGDLFCPSPEHAQRMKFALDSLFILRTAAANLPNGDALSAHNQTVAFIFRALAEVRPATDLNSEFLLYTIELMYCICAKMVIQGEACDNPLPTLQEIACTSNNRSLIVAAIGTLDLLLSNPANSPLISADSPLIYTAIKYLPLFVDEGLMTVCLDILHTHFSHQPTAKAFLLNPNLSKMLRVLITHVRTQQMEEAISHDVSGSLFTAPPLPVKEYELVGEELDRIAALAEPERCFTWMRTMFVTKSESEMTQVAFWNLYKDTFSPLVDKPAILNASDVIKNVTTIFPNAQAMVISEPVQRFVVRGVDRRRKEVTDGRFQCRWNHAQCQAEPFSKPEELYSHILDHLDVSDDDTLFVCIWGSCTFVTPSFKLLQSHLSTHVPSLVPTPRHTDQPDDVTLSSRDYPHPTPQPNLRPAPPAPRTMSTYLRASADPNSNALTALLIVRLLFLAAFISTDEAPRIDEDHFGFPGIIAEDNADENNGALPVDERSRLTAEGEKQAEAKGQEAFASLRYLLEDVKVKDESLAAWIWEMTNPTTTEARQSNEPSDF